MSEQFVDITPSRQSAFKRLEGKTAVITGGASGIGRAAALRMAAEGARVAILDLNGTEAEAVASLLCAAGQTAICVQCDVAVDGEVALAMRRVAEEFSSIDVLFNSAGIAIRYPAGQQDEAGWDRVLSVNLKGTYLCSRHALPYFSQTGGSIIHTSSVTGITGVRNRAAYSSSKGAIVALTRSMALDYASRHIRVNCICPGFVKTPLLSALLGDPERAARLTALHPLERLGEPDEVACAVLFLASDESSWITGHALVIDGGFSAGHAADV